MWSVVLCFLPVVVVVEPTLVAQQVAVDLVVVQQEL
jgi:hypothetical protein